MREFVGLLTLHRDHPMETLQRTVKQALELGAAHLEGVHLCLRQLLSPEAALPKLKVDHPRLIVVSHQSVQLEQYNGLPRPQASG